jgi:hypothetical protein
MIPVKTERPIAAPPERRVPRHRARKGTAAAAGVVVIAGAAAAVVALHPFGSAGNADAGTAGGVTPPAVAAVTRQSLAEQTQVSATLDYTGGYSVLGRVGGTITWLPAAGQVIGQGQVLYRVDDGTPVFLLYGQVPAWRTLHEGLTGEDVEQLNHDLVALGYASSAYIAELGWNYFSWETMYGLQQLQEALGLPPTGRLTLGQAVFLPSAIRVTTLPASLGSAASGTVLTATSTRQMVAIQLDTAQESEVAVGDKVSITLPDSQVIPGVVSAIGAVATASSGGGSPTIPVEVTPSDAAAIRQLVDAPVEVNITTASVSNVLVVPVDALVALPDGGYAVQVVGARGTEHLVPVSLGMFDDASGVVQVSGAGLTVGQHVVVPS